MRHRHSKNATCAPLQQAPMTRRGWLQATAGGAGLLACSFVPLLAQQPPLREALRQMVAVTGSELPEQWAEPTTGLVGVILEYSKTLRALDLGEREPATIFRPR